MNNSTYHIFFNNLSNPLRIKIITSLKDKEKNVTEISKELKVEQSKVSHALKNLRNCKIVEVKQKGKERIYSLNKKTIVPMLKLIDKHAKNFCDCKNCAGRCGRAISREANQRFPFERRGVVAREKKSNLILTTSEVGRKR